MAPVESVHKRQEHPVTITTAVEAVMYHILGFSQLADLTDKSNSNQIWFVEAQKCFSSTNRILSIV